MSDLSVSQMVTMSKENWEVLLAENAALKAEIIEIGEHADAAIADRHKVFDELSAEKAKSAKMVEALKTWMTKADDPFSQRVGFTNRVDYIRFVKSLAELSPNEKSADESERGK